MARCMPISLVTLRLSQTRRPSMSTTTMSDAFRRHLLIAVGVARIRSSLRRTERFPAVPGTKPNRYNHLPKRASCLRCTISTDRSGAVELRAMLRVVVKPLFSKAVGCIRHQIPLFELFLAVSDGNTGNATGKTRMVTNSRLLGRVRGNPRTKSRLRREYPPSTGGLGLHER